MTRVLVIDDEPLFIENVAQYLHNYDVIGAANGEEGIKQAMMNPPDVILCDLMMPGMDGFTVLERLRHYPPMRRVPFIFLTAVAERTAMRKGMNAGADDYLTKPFTREELIHAIESRIEKQQDYQRAAQEKLETVRKDLVRMVAHELRTPLVPLKMVGDIVNLRLGQLTGAEIAEFFEIINTSTRRMTHLVQQIVLITQLETGELSEDVFYDDATEIGAWDLLMASVNLAREFAIRNDQVPVHLDMAEEDVALVVVLNAMKHALAEIITNAMHFADDDGVQIDHWVTEDRIYVIKVTDRGPGMEPNTIKLAFREFHQINREHQEQQGIGLGLSLADRIVRMHGGTIQMYSVPGEGTQVSVLLPILEVEEDEA